MKKINNYPDDTIFCLYENDCFVAQFYKDETMNFKAAYPNGKVYACTEKRNFDINFIIKQVLLNIVEAGDAYQYWDELVMDKLEESECLQKCQEIIDEYPAYYPVERVLWNPYNPIEKLYENSNNTKCNTTSSSNTRSSTR